MAQPGCFNQLVFSQLWSPSASITYNNLDPQGNVISPITNNEFVDGTGIEVDAMLTQEYLIDKYLTRDQIDIPLSILVKRQNLQIAEETLQNSPRNNQWIPHGLWTNFVLPSGEVLFPENCSEVPIDISLFPLSLRRQMQEQYIERTDTLYLHEWEKHGNCYSNSPKVYFEQVFELQERFADTSFLEENAGKWVKYEDLADALIFDSRFVQLICISQPDGQVFNQRSIFFDRKFNFNEASSLVPSQCVTDEKVYIRAAPTYMSASDIITSLNNAPPMNIGFDIDATILASSPVFQFARENATPGSEEFFNIINQSDQGYSLLKQSALEIVQMHQQRGDNIYFITSRRRTPNQKVTQALEFFLGLEKANVIFTNGSDKTAFIKKLNVKIYYGDADSDIISSLSANARPIRVLRPSVTNARGLYRPGFFGEDVYIRSDR